MLNLKLCKNDVYIFQVPSHRQLQIDSLRNTVNRSCSCKCTWARERTIKHTGEKMELLQHGIYLHGYSLFGLSKIPI